MFISKDNFLRGDNSRKVQHQQPRKPRKKTKPPALTKKHKKKRRRGPRRPQKPIPPAVPQGNLSMPTSVSLPVEASQIRSVGQWLCFPLGCGLRTPVFWAQGCPNLHSPTPQLSLTELPVLYTLRVLCFNRNYTRYNRCM